MMLASSTLQTAMFCHLNDDPSLMKYFRQTIMAGTDWPQFSFDGMSSSYRHPQLSLVGHRIEFSVWAELQAFADLSDVTDSLTDRMLDPFEVPDFHLIELNLEAFSTAPDTGARLRVNRLTYLAMTQPKNASEALS